MLYDANHNVIGIGTNDMGIAKDGSKKETFQRGVELRGLSLSLSVYLSISLFLSLSLHFGGPYTHYYMVITSGGLLRCSTPTKHEFMSFQHEPGFDFGPNSKAVRT